MKTFLLENKLALITGGGSGIGFGVAQAFIAAGARVVLTGRRKDALERAVAELGPRAQYIVNDVTRHKMIPPLVAEIERDLGPIDILVNNAGAHLKKRPSRRATTSFCR